MNHSSIFHIQISLSTNFQLKLTIAIFWNKFGKKGSYFQSKTDEINTIIEFCIFELVFVTNVTLSMFLTLFRMRGGEIDRNYDVITSISKYRYFKKAWVAIFADIIKIITRFIKKIFKDT